MKRNFICVDVNRQYWIMWADENPHWFDVQHLHPKKLTMWMGVGIEGVVGPVFWESRATEKGIDSSWMMSLLLDRVIPRASDLAEL